MIYEIQAQFTRIDSKGNEKVIKEKYMVENAETFGDAETQGYDYCTGEKDLEIVAIKRSKVREIINKRNTDDDRVWVTDVADVRTNDEGEELEIVYKVALYATSWDDANAKVKKYLEQGFDMTILSIKKTKFLEVI